MQSLVDKPVLTTAGGGSNAYPPTEVAQRSGDGEGDGKFVAAGVATAEAYANRQAMVEVGGLHLGETMRGLGRRQLQRSQFAISTGRLTLRHEIPPLYASYAQ
ncbi:MAG: hypothetical protein QFB87_00430 [Patescibacteria group bacterium]|nr:hypothetical protein [Patescibacteria group bacterium]